MSIRDIAKEANVSIASVSRVLNNKPGVGPEVRARIEKIIRDHGYTPNPLARGLASRGNLVGVLVTDLKDAHFAVTANVIQTELKKNGMTTLLGCTGHGIEEKKAYIRDFLEYRANGIILVGSEYDDEVLAKLLLDDIDNIPFVMTNSSVNQRNIQSVIVEVSSGAFDCCEHLISCGHQEILFLRDMDSISNRKKYSGYCEALAAHGLPVKSEHVGCCEGTVDSGYRFIIENPDFLKKGTAIMCCRDEVALGVSRAVSELGMRIPEDIAITGYNNAPFSEYALPSLTTIDNQHAVVGTMAVTLLMNVLNNDSFSANLSVKPTLVVRESTGGKNYEKTPICL